MGLAHVLHMNGGVGKARYANSSFIQQKVISLKKPIREEAITSLYYSTLSSSLAIADMGCASGPNTLSVVSEIIKTVEKLCRELNHKSPEFKVFLKDLPRNDFNNIFRSLDSFKEKLSDEMESKFGSCYFFGVPGSFYCRVFPAQSLNFFHSSYSLQWLSKVPEGAKELVEGGRMVLTLLGRRSDDPSSKESGYIWELMAMALNDKGLTDKETS